MEENDYILLLLKRFSGEIDAEEAKNLEEWTHQSEKNARLATEYRAIWDHSEVPAGAFQLDMDAEYGQLQKRLAAAPRRGVVSMPLMRVAAAIALLVVAVWGFRRLAGAPHNDMVLEAANGVGQRSFQLADGTQIWLRQNSTLGHPLAFSGDERRVKLQGEAYFKVAHDAAHPFRIDLPGGGVVEVLGTQFGVQAMSETGAATVLVREGKVRLSPDGKSAGVVLVRGDRAVYDPVAAKIHLQKVSSYNDLAWQAGGLEFIRTPLRDVIADLEKYYDMTIDLQNPALESCLHTAPLTNQPIREVLKSLAVIYQVKVSERAPGHFVLSGGVCQ